MECWEMVEIGCEEAYGDYMDTKYIFCKAEELPAATYLGNDEWLGIDGTHFFVTDYKG